MARPVVLKCPNCGALLEKGQMKCPYCGAELVLLPDRSSYRFKSEIVCPNCGAINEGSAWFCVNCGTILTKDIGMLKELQKKIRFEQERVKSKYMPSWIREKLEPDEFIYFVFKMGDNNVYAVTDKRIIKSKYGKYEECPLSEVVSIGQVRFKPEGILFPTIKGSFEVNTFQGTIIFDGFSYLDAQNCGIFHAWVNTALKNHNQRKKDVRKLILQLSLEQTNNKRS